MSAIDVKTQPAPVSGDAVRLERMVKDGTDEKVAVKIIAARNVVLAAIESKVTAVKCETPESKKMKGMTFNVLALSWTDPSYYVGSDSNYLTNQAERLITVASHIGSVAPDWVALQELEPQSKDYLIHLLGGNYISSELGHSGDYNGNMEFIGCAVFVHVKHKSYTTFSTDVVDGRGFAAADIAAPGRPALRAGSYHVVWKPLDRREKVYAQIKAVAEKFKGFESGCLGTDSNLFAGPFAAGLVGTPFAGSIAEADYPTPSFLHGENLDQCGAMDFIAHYGMPKGSKVNPPLRMEMPKNKEDLPKARDAYYVRAGSDHLPQVTEFSLSSTP